MGLLETTKLKSVTAGIQWRGQWDVIGDRGDERELEVEIIEDAVVYGSKVLKFKLDVSHTEPFEESNFIVVQERLLKDTGNSLTLLCMHQRVVDVAGNDRVL